MCCGNSTGQLAVDVDVFAVDRVTDPDLGGDRLGALVYTPTDGCVGVGIDQARSDMKTGTVDDVSTLGGAQVLSDLDYLAADDQQVCLLEDPIGPAGPDGGVGDEDCCR